MSVFAIVIAVVIAPLLLLLCREIACWYMKTTGIYNVLLAILEELRKK